MRRLVALAPALLLAAGCGGDGGSANAGDIRAAAEKTARAGSLEADFRISGQGLSGNGSGVFNTGKARSGQLTMQVNASGQRVPVDTIVTGDVFYMRSPVFSRSIARGKQWIKLDLGRLAQQRGVDLSSLLDASPTPTNALVYLAGVDGDVDEVGSERVAGTSATHYKVTSNLRRAADSTSGSTRQSVQRVMSQSGLKRLPLDVWVGENGYIRKVRYEEHAGRRQTARVTMELHDFDDPVEIDPPPSDSVVDLLELQGG